MSERASSKRAPAVGERITSAQAASIIGVCAKTMRSYAERGMVPGAVQFDTGTWRFDEAKLRHWLRKRETQGWATTATSSSGTGSGMPAEKFAAGTYDAAYEQLLSPKRKDG